MKSNPTPPLPSSIPHQVVWGGPRELTLANTVVAAALFFTCHDMIWAPLHRLFHSHPALYRAFHKFHHKQASACDDAAIT